MKKFFCVLMLFANILGFSAAAGIVEEADEGNAKSDVSYAFGMLLAADFKNTPLEFNYSSLLKGFRDTMEGLETRYDMNEAVEKAQAAFQAAMEKQAEMNEQAALSFFAENGEKSGIVTTESGLQYEILIEGTGRQPVSSDFVRVNYQGALLDGAIFDSSFERGAPEDLPLEGVIPGWSEGLLLMKEGGKSRFYIPPALAYGNRGMGAIPPNSALVFEVELLEIIEPPKPPAPPAEGEPIPLEPESEDPEPSA